MKITYIILLMILMFSCENKYRESQPSAENKINTQSHDSKEKSPEKNLIESPLLKTKNQFKEFGIVLDTAELIFEYTISPSIIPKDMPIDKITLFGKLPSLTSNDLWVDSLKLKIEENSQTIIAPYGFSSCYCNKDNGYDFFEYLLKFEDVNFDGTSELAINDTQGGGRHSLYNYYFLNPDKTSYELNNIFTLPNLGIDPINKTYSAVSSGGGINYYMSKYTLEHDSMHLIYYEKQWDKKEMRAYIKETWDTQSIKIDTIYY
ncbi:MAG: hypothetical protein R2825_02475 [Saprospiraceae bacterium]